jgi:hypothetical protein
MKRHHSEVGLIKVHLETGSRVAPHHHEQLIVRPPAGINDDVFASSAVREPVGRRRRDVAAAKRDRTIQLLDEDASVRIHAPIDGAELHDVVSL